MRKIGLFGGTFDPPHYGHLIMAEQVYEALQLDEIWFIPTNQPPHKENAKSKGMLRYEMIQTAISDHSAFKADPIELERNGKSYTIDTIAFLQKKHPDVCFYFIIGGDMVEYLPKWHRIDELIELVTFVGVKRPGYQLDSKYQVLEVDMPLIDISSTMIREKVANSQSIRYLTPSSVRKLIDDTRLYLS